MYECIIFSDLNLPLHRSVSRRRTLFLFAESSSCSRWTTTIASMFVSCRTRLNLLILLHLRAGRRYRHTHDTSNTAKCRIGFCSLLFLISNSYFRIKTDICIVGDAGQLPGRGAEQVAPPPPAHPARRVHCHLGRERRRRLFRQRTLHRHLHRQRGPRTHAARRRRAHLRTFCLSRSRLLS